MHAVPVALGLGPRAVVERTCIDYHVRRATRSLGDVHDCALRPYA